MTGDVLRAYLAGFFDGEGSVRIHKTLDHYFTLVVSVAQIDRTPLELFLERYGGAIAWHRSSMVKGTGNRRRSYLDWRMAGPRARAMLEDLLPFLIVKRAEAELGIWYQRLRSGWHHRPLSQFERAERESFFLALRDLKRLEGPSSGLVVP